ncbi:hypothetical protein ABK040_003496 [Willaertia magna]
MHQQEPEVQTPLFSDEILDAIERNIEKLDDDSTFSRTLIELSIQEQEHLVDRLSSFNSYIHQNNNSQTKELPQFSFTSFLIQSLQKFGVNIPPMIASFLPNEEELKKQRLDYKRNEMIFWKRNTVQQIEPHYKELTVLYSFAPKKD